MVGLQCSNNSNLKMLNKPDHVIPQMKPGYSLNTICYCFESITSKSLVVSKTNSPT